MEALVTIVPVMGSVNERRPPREQDWDEARQTGTLPDISDTSAGLLPLLNAILIAPDAKWHPGLKRLRAEFVARILLPLLQHSQEEHRKWVTLFLARHKVNLTADDLPPTPITSQALFRTLIFSS